MPRYETIFEVSWRSNDLLLSAASSVAIGIALFIAATVLIVVRKRINPDSSDRVAIGEREKARTGFRDRKTRSPGFLLFCGIMWLTLTVLIYYPPIAELPDLYSAYRGGNCKIVEGVVHVEHEQPYHGHAKGDIISVGGKRFEVNYFQRTPGYNTTIAHGGALKNGVHARLYHHLGVIARVDIAVASRK